MEKTNIINFELKKYEKELKDIINTIGLAEFDETDIEVPLYDYEKELLLKATEQTLEILSYQIEGDEENIALLIAMEDQCELFELLDESIYYNEPFYLQPIKHKCILMSLELGGNIDVNNKDINVTQRNEKDHQVLTNLYRNTLEKCKIIEKIISPWENPDFLKGK